MSAFRLLLPPLLLTTGVVALGIADAGSSRGVAQHHEQQQKHRGIHGEKPQLVRRARASADVASSLTVDSSGGVHGASTAGLRLFARRGPSGVPEALSCVQDCPAVQESLDDEKPPECDAFKQCDMTACTTFEEQRLRRVIVNHCDWAILNEPVDEDEQCFENTSMTCAEGNACPGDAMGPSSCHASWCLCKVGYCVKDGKCTRKEDSCQLNTRTKCPTEGCLSIQDEIGPASCHSSGMCMCRHGFCWDAVSGKCKPFGTFSTGPKKVKVPGPVGVPAKKPEDMKEVKENDGAEEENGTQVEHGDPGPDGNATIYESADVSTFEYAVGLNLLIFVVGAYFTQQYVKNALGDVAIANHVESKDAAKISFTLQNMKYAALQENVALFMDLKRAFARTIAKDVGVSDSHVTLFFLNTNEEIKAEGSVEVPEGMNVEEVIQALKTSKTLGDAMAMAGMQVSGISEASSGSIRVDDVQVEQTTISGPHGSCPASFFVTCPAEEQLSGRYVLLDGEWAHNFPIWKHELSGQYYLFSSQSGNWMIGDEDERALNFECDTAKISSQAVHGPLLPHEMPAALWLRFVGNKWQPDSDIRVEIRD